LTLTLYLTLSSLRRLLQWNRRLRRHLRLVLAPFLFILFIVFFLVFVVTI
jgi:hypothetical protein